MSFNFDLSWNSCLPSPVIPAPWHSNVHNVHFRYWLRQLDIDSMMVVVDKKRIKLRDLVNGDIELDEYYVHTPDDAEFETQSGLCLGDRTLERRHKKLCTCNDGAASIRVGLW